jgi:ABC-type ATPase involved in cell division/GNAT superfamily N-acetyltransferase
MDLQVRNSCKDFNSYRAARVKSLFNAESGAEFNLDAALDIDDKDWKLGVIVGPSGSGKSSLGRMILGPDAVYSPDGWPTDKPIVDAIAPDGDFDAVTNALATVGLGSVPCWLRPYYALSNGERFRADLARVISEAPAGVVIDEFSSVVDRQIAKFGALAFQKAWKRTGGRCVLLSCHYDVLDWLEPDWVYDTAKQSFARGSLWRRPKFDLQIQQTDASYWPLFKPHYYLDLHLPVAAQYFVGTVEGEPVCHMAMCTMSKGKNAFEGRGTRLVVMPEWQGAGVGMRFLNTICDMWRRGENKWGKPVTTVFHTSHPGLCAGLRRDPKWRQLSAILYGANKVSSRKSLAGSARHQGKGAVGAGTGYGGHFRAVQGFRYYG